MKTKFNLNDMFPEIESLGERPWGSEDLLALVPNKFSFKRIYIKAGHKGGLQYHRKKDEVAYLVEGEMLIRFDLGDGILQEKTITSGQAVHFPIGLVHQEEALSDCLIIEASTPFFNDRVRMEEVYGMGAPQGLPTTELNDIIER